MFSFTTLKKFSISSIVLNLFATVIYHSMSSMVFKQNIELGKNMFLLVVLASYRIN